MRGTSGVGLTAIAAVTEPTDEAPQLTAVVTGDIGQPEADLASVLPARLTPPGSTAGVFGALVALAPAAPLPPLPPTMLTFFITTPGELNSTAP